MRIEVKREATEKIPEGDKGLARDTLRNFINTYHGKTTKYVISDLPKPMYKDFLVPPFVGCGSFADRLVEVDVWIGGGGSSSRIHKDAFHIINCLFNGTKEWKMIELKHEKNIYKVPEEEGRLSGISYVDPMKVDLKKFPNIQKVPWSFVNVTPGDCLFIPRQMYHQVRSFGTHNLAISMLFSRFVKEKTLNFSDCPASGFKPLTDFDPDWQYEGSGDFPMGRADLEYGTKAELYSLLDGKGNVVLGKLKDSLKNVETSKKHGRTDEEVDLLTEEIYAIFGKKVGGMITQSEIKALKKEPLRKIACMLALSDPYNTMDYEYYHIEALAIIRILTDMFEGEPVLKKKEFLNRYVSELGGTQKVGEEFFDNLGGHGRDSITKDVVIKSINSSIAKYDEFELKFHSQTRYGKKENVIPSVDYGSMLDNASKIDDIEREERAREVDENGNLLYPQGERDDDEKDDAGDGEGNDEENDGEDDEEDGDNDVDSDDEGNEKDDNGEQDSEGEGDEENNDDDGEDTDESEGENDGSDELDDPATGQEEDAESKEKNTVQMKDEL